MTDCLPYCHTTCHILSLFLGAFGAYTFYYIFSLVDLESGREVNNGYVVVLETVSLLAHGACEVYVVEVIVTIASAHAVLLVSCAIVNLVQQMVLAE